MKNKHNLQRLIGAIITVVGIVIIVISVFFTESDNRQNVFGVALALPFIAVGVIWYSIATSNSRRICDKCGGLMKGCSYEWQEVRREPCGSGAPNSYKVTVDIIAICPNCGTRKNFYKTFQVHSSENPEYKVAQFCRSHFGH